MTIQARSVAAMPIQSPLDPPPDGQLPALKPGEAILPDQSLDSMLKLFRPLLPTNVFSVSAKPRRYEEFIHAIEEGKKAMRFSSVDRFE
jgi:hypothetical protein